MSIQGIQAVAGLELKQRARTSRWPLVLGIWFVVIAAVALLTWFSLRNQQSGSATDGTYSSLGDGTYSDYQPAPQWQAGRSMYDLITFFVLGLSLLIVPSLTATSVNSDREQGVLATLQTTLLTPADIIVGKWIASIVVVLVFLATALPFLVWGWIAGHAGFFSILGSMFTLVAVLAVICAVGLMFSTLTARPVASAVLTYFAVAALVFGTLIAFLLTLKPMETTDTVRIHGIASSWYDKHPNDQPTSKDCVTYTEKQQRIHTERVWWLLALNPVVVVADAGYNKPPDNSSDVIAPMYWISEGVGQARKGPSDEVQQQCWTSDTSPAPSTPDARAGQSPIWPYGLGVLSLLGAGAMLVATRRTRTPVHRLPNGTRIA